MPDPNDDLIAQMTQAGLYPQQIAALQHQLGLGHQWMQPQHATGANVGNTYVAASPLEHLSNAIRQIVGAKMAGSALGKERELTSQVGSDRLAYAKALSGMGGKTVAGDYGEPIQGVGANPQGMQQLATLGAASGDPAMQHASQTAMQGQHFAQQQHVLENTMRHQQNLEAQGWGRLGQGDERIRQGDERIAALLRAADLKGIRYDPNTSQFVDIRPMVNRKRPSALPLATGNTAPPPSGDASAPSAANGAPLGKWQDKALKDLGNDFNPSSKSSGEFGKNQARLNAAQRLLTLAVDPKTGGPADLNPQQMSEISGSLATLIGGGSTGEGTRRELTPYTRGRSMAEIMQWLTNEPHGADQQAFVKQMIDTAKREQGVAKQSIEQVRGQLGTKHQRILRSNPNEAAKVLQGFGWDLGPDGMPMLKPAEQAAAATDAASLRKKYGL